MFRAKESYPRVFSRCRYYIEVFLCSYGWTPDTGSFHDFTQNPRDRYAEPLPPLTFIPCLTMTVYTLAGLHHILAMFRP